MAYQRPHSPPSRKRTSRNPNRLSASSLGAGAGYPAPGSMMPGGFDQFPPSFGGSPHEMYGYSQGPPPPAPGPPRSGQPTPHWASPRSSNDSLNGGGYFPPAPAPPPPGAFGHPGTYPAYPPAPPPAPQPAMRGGDAGHLRRSHTTATANRPPVVHQPASDYDSYTYDDYSGYSGRSPDEPPGQPFMVIPGTGGNARSYHPGSNYSEGSFMDPDPRAQKGYMLSTGGAHRFGRNNERGEAEYHVSGPEPRRSRKAGRGSTLGDGPPTRRERSMSRQETTQELMKLQHDDEDDFDSSSADRPDPRRQSSGAITSSGALVRSRSRSASQGPQPAPAPPAPSNSNALVPHKPVEDPPSPPQNNTIRLEVAGQAIDIAYSGDTGGKPIGITINTSSRTIGVPESPPGNAAAPAPAAIGPPPPPQMPMIPGPPPPGVRPQIMPAPGPGGATSSDEDSPLRGNGDPRASLYESLAQLSLDAPQPPTRAGPAPVLHDERTRSRKDRATMPPTARKSSRSRSRRRPSTEDPLWTKISRDIVSRRAVLVKGYQHEETPGAIIIYQVLNEAEIDELVELSDQIRSGKVEVVRRGSSKRAPSRPRNTRRPVSIHGYPGPGPSKNRPAPPKPAIVYGERAAGGPPGSFPGEGGPPEVPEPPEERGSLTAPAPPVAVVQTKKGGLVEDPEMPGTYIGYSRGPPKKG